jgi:hypothetical protein
MAASKYDFTIEQGSSFRLALVYKDKNNNIVDITDWCARLTWTTDSGVTQIFTTENSDPTLYSFSIDGINGKITLLIPANTTNSFGFNMAKYDLELQSDDDLYTGGGKQVIRILYGTASIQKRFSRSSDAFEC